VHVLKRWLLAALPAALLILSPAYAQKRVALTFDDVPRMAGAFMSQDERTEKLITALKTAKVKQAAFFLNPCNLTDPARAGGEARIAAYTAAGHVIANHSCTHPSLNDTTSDAYLADIDQAAEWLKGRPGYRPWFRFPYLREGGEDKVKRDAVRAGLKARGLRNGYVTADGNDWNLEQLTIDAVNQGKTMDMKALRNLYIQTQLSALDYHDELARRTLGRSPAHVLLLHETDLAAMYINDLVAELQRNGWEVITADKAFADPINKMMPDVPVADGTLTGSMAWERDIDPPLSPVWITQSMSTFLFKRRVLKETDPK
jgi:peptidoglycan-N-acetylglucosamine deacetylase